MVYQGLTWFEQKLNKVFKQFWDEVWNMVLNMVLHKVETAFKQR